MEGNFWLMPADDQRKAIAKAKPAMREVLVNQLASNSGHPSTGSGPTGAPPGHPSYPWLPVPQGSTLHESGAPTGTPFLGTVAEIESSMRQGGWDVKDLPGETIDQKWFHFVYRKPLSGYEDDPLFTNNEATSSKDRGNPQGLM